MQKKMLAVAVASALGAPALALAQGASTVQIFGTLYYEYDWARQGRGGAADATGNIAKRQNVDFLQAPGSEIGFKGEEALGGSLAAWFQCSSTLNFTNSTAGGGAEFCTRNSALGMKGSFGNVFVGRWDTPFKRTISPTNVGGNDTGIFGTAFLLTGGSTSTLENSNRSTFKRRQGNLISYDSPVFGGFQAMGSVSTANNGTAGAGTTGTTGQTSSKPRIWSLGAQYSAGPIYVSAGYEKHKEFSAAGGELDDHGWHAGASYRWGPVLFGGQYTRQKFENTGGAGATDAKYRAWTFGVDWTIVGAHGLRANYTSVGDAKGNATNTAAAGAATTNTLFGGTYRPAPCFGVTVATASCSNTGARLYQIRYVYTFSKRTEANLGYVRLRNDDNAAYALGGLSSPQIGEKQSAVAFTLKHTF